MQKDKIWKLFLMVLLPLSTFIFNHPEGLTDLSWKLMGVYLATILGLVLKPYNEPIILLIALALSGGIIGNYTQDVLETKDVLSGYSSGTTWLVFSAFTLSSAFVSTGLGKRIAYHLIDKIGHTSLGLGYAIAFLDLLVAPATPSNTARAGGIVLPIFNSISVALQSDPETSPTRIGRYLMINIYMVTKTTSYMFMTAMAGNLLAISLASEILQVELTWMSWFLAALVPGLIMLVLIPFIVYKCATPDLKNIDNSVIAAEGLKELGPMQLKEKGLLAVFAFALLGWIFSSQIGMDSYIVAIAAMALTLVLGVVSWSDVLQNKGGWTTLIWYGGIIGLSSVLAKSGYFIWLAETMKAYFTFQLPSYFMLGILLLITIIVRYLFASGGAYAAAMIPVFATLGMVTGVEPMVFMLAIMFSNSYGGCITHYGGAAGPVIFAVGYNDIKSWWITGTVVALLTYLVHMLIGVPWWEFLIAQGLV